MFLSLFHTVLTMLIDSNIHNANILVKEIVELFERVKHHKELHQTILAFSVSHDNKTVKIAGRHDTVDLMLTCPTISYRPRASSHIDSKDSPRPVWSPSSSQLITQSGYSQTPISNHLSTFACLHPLSQPPSMIQSLQP